MQDYKGSETKVIIDAGTQLTCDVTSGHVYIKLLNTGNSSGTSLISPDVTTSTVPSGSHVPIVEGLSGPVIGKHYLD